MPERWRIGGRHSSSWSRRFAGQLVANSCDKAARPRVMMSPGRGAREAPGSWQSVDCVDYHTAARVLRLSGIVEHSWPQVRPAMPAAVAWIRRSPGRPCGSSRPSIIQETQPIITIILLYHRFPRPIQSFLVYVNDCTSTASSFHYRSHPRTGRQYPWPKDHSASDRHVSVIS